MPSRFCELHSSLCDKGKKRKADEMEDAKTPESKRIIVTINLKEYKVVPKEITYSASNNCRCLRDVHM